MKALWIFFLITGLATLAISGYVFVDSRRFASEAEKTIGTVVGLEHTGSSKRRKGRRSRPMYSAVVHYRTLGGEPVRFTNRRTKSTDPGYEVGQQVSVWYRPVEPQKAIIYNSWWSLWWPMVVFPPLGVIFIACAFVTKAVVHKGRYN